MRLKEAANRISDVRDEIALLGDPALVGVYYAKLVEIEKGLRGAGAHSLAAFMKPLFRLAQQRGGQAAAENQAALLALVIYFGDPRFERLIGKVRTGSLEGHRRKGPEIRLNGRNDLMLHFLVSAGLQLVSNHGAAMAIGEFKELLDSTGGGTGFSFVDLGADRTGLQFAKVATETAGGAKQLQKSSRQRPRSGRSSHASGICRSVCRMRLFGPGSAAWTTLATKRWSISLTAVSTRHRRTADANARSKFNRSYRPFGGYGRIAADM